ncbi:MULTISPECIES: 2TM domain-containing protein [Cellulophaga]|uniref:Signal transduction histidine kinase, LytS n=2 Tax=Cellulophaga TaxID=104264 RepID=F0RI51_CELLC|nr:MULTISPECIES: 2TM domain-containing protein [Cellulophaga]ADY30332.1 signal transduction histidine kinase, LytS [Cellulophaga lytica DSM 7489]AIM61321.1 histidine kinase [Cellulophaga lytica]APU11224.1 histidine kinase [Cellulophaga lytica]EWH14342.1 signal transduction histidine kinase LytS [Cellulophaga geojensis KL-A]MDO6854591.1 2TM domain-containing protein [Cellulophaga lytica]
MFNIKKILKISIYITVVISVINVLGSIGDGFSLIKTLRGIAITFLYSFVLSVVNSYYFQYISNIYSWEEQPKKRLWLGALGSVVLTVIAFAIVKFIIAIVLFGTSVEYYVNNQTLSPYMIAILISIVVSLALHAYYFYKYIQDSKIKEQKIIAGTASAKFDALKNQLDPHFLFNSLNVLTSLIEEDPFQAQKFTTSLSKVYRYVLEQKNKDLVTVDEELQFAKTYIRLLKMRFEDSIVFEVPEKSSNPDAKIIPLSLQLLLENAVKHNIVSSNKPLHLKVEEIDNMLIVSNNLQEKKVVKKSSGVGLKNIHQRYQMLTDRTVIINKGETEFSVHLPILTKQVSTMETQKVHLDEKRYQRAKERVEKIKGFTYNLVAYCFVIPFLIWLNYQTTDFPWSVFPAFGWGLGLTAHGMEAFGYNPLFGKNWENRKIKEYMEDDKF